MAFPVQVVEHVVLTPHVHVLVVGLGSIHIVCTFVYLYSVHIRGREMAHE